MLAHLLLYLPLISTFHLLSSPPIPIILRSMEFRSKSPPAGVRYTIQTNLLGYDLEEFWSRRRGTGGEKVAGTTILKDVTCEARPGEITAIVGPSGAGKSTLLSILSGDIHPNRINGEILVNGQDMDIGRFRRVSGYVTQLDDSLFPLLTVEETLRYSARLRVKATEEVEVEERVREVAMELGLQEVMKARVGGGGRGVSGGERRRVSIGVELVHRPAVLLLDEPTSGLDSASALQIVALLKSMATNYGKTIILTIHQPGYRIMNLIDRIILIAGGTVRHNGSLSLLTERLTNAGHRIPPHINLIDYTIDAITTTSTSTCTTSFPKYYYSSSSLTTTTSPSSTSTSTTTTTDTIHLVYANSRPKEAMILGQRFFKNILRTNQLFTARIIQSTAAGVVLGTIFWNAKDIQSRLGFFAFTLTFLLSSTTEGLPIFLQERTILTRETTRGAYRISSYVIANTVVFLPFLLAIALLYSLPVYWIIGLRKEFLSFLYFSLVVWLVVLMANSFVSCFSALVPNFIIGNSLIAGFMGSFFLFSGYFIAKENIPKYWIFMHYLSLFKYPFEAFLVNEYGGGRGSEICIERRNGSCVLDGIMFLKKQEVDESKRWVNVGVMVGFVVGYRVLCFLILWVRCHKMRR